MTVRRLPRFRAHDLSAFAGAPRPAAAACDWYSIEAAKDAKRATIRIYEPIGGWFGVSAAAFAEELGALDVDEIDLRLNSGGGSVFDGVAIHNSLLAHRARIDVTVDGVAASIASVIAMAGDSVTMGAGSRMMIHNPSAGVIGQAADLRAIANLLDEIGKDIAGFYAARGGKDVAHWLDLMDAETWYSAQEAVDAGLADAVLGKPKSTEDSTAASSLKIHDLSAYGFRYADRDQAPDPGAVARSTRSAHIRARHAQRQEARGK
jgi:ATP-dependent Clp endopeptidase proteolytic subunit ClpP